MNADNVEFVWDSTVTDFVADGNLRGVKIKNKLNGNETEIACDGVFASIGRKPATEFLKGTVALDPNGYIVADETTKTAIDGVFAAGDVADPIYRQAVCAAASGCKAAMEAERFLMSQN